MNLDTTTCVHLGWDEIKNTLAEYACTPLGKDACLKLSPLDDQDQINAQQERCRQLVQLIDQGIYPPIEAVDEIDVDLTRASKQGVLSAEAIIRIARIMAISSKVGRFLLSEGNQGSKALVDLARGSHDLANQAKDLRAAFDDSGELRDSASPELMRLRKSARSISSGIKNKLQRMIQTPKISSILRESYITQRGDRYVLPVRADSHERFEGIVHDASQTGATLFIEPAAIIEDGNRLKIAQAAVVDEEQRILSEYSKEIANYQDDIQDNLVMLTNFDVLVAIVSLAKKTKGNWIDIEGVGIDLKQARHPLMVIAEEPTIANDIRLDRDQRGLIITGPNAGGKTVALKTAGLITIMAQSGLAVPAAEGSRLGLFRSLVSVIGDEQDLGRGLSTFSAHIKRIAKILKNANPNTLVLLDELAADTDPRHGAALAASILESLINAGALVIVTTHFEELKHLAYQDQRFANASVGFDLKSMEPTYELHPDVPGRSLTIDIARRLGIAEPVLESAAKRLDGHERQIDKILDGLEQEKHAVAELRKELAVQKNQALAEAKKHEAAADKLQSTQEKILTQGRDEILKEIASTRREVAQMIESLKSGPNMKAAVAASQRLKSIESKIIAQKTSMPSLPAPSQTVRPDQIKSGDLVKIVSIDKQGEITSIDQRAGMVTVLLGKMRTRVPIEQVVLLSKPPKQKRQKRKLGPKHAQKQAPFEAGKEIRTPDNTLDLRGLHSNEALARLDKFLDQLFGRNEAAAFIIHGHGTGALKMAVREYLADSPYPSHFRAGTLDEGGDGVTVVRLK
jgi:DNA mismatch repair protein MutS2